MTFIDLEKIYNKVLRNLILKVLKVKMVLWHYIELIKDMYANANTCMKTLTGKTKNFNESPFTPYIYFESLFLCPCDRWINS